MSNAVHLAVILQSRAEVYVAQRRWNEAAPVYRQLIAVYEPLLDRDPKNETFLKDRPPMYASLANCYAALSQWGSAATAIETSLDRMHAIELRRPLTKAEEQARADAAANLEQWRRR